MLMVIVVVMMARCQCLKGPLEALVPKYCLLIFYYEARQIFWMKNISNSFRCTLQNVQDFNLTPKFWTH